MDHQILSALLSYDKSTGELRWLKNKGSRAKANTVAGNKFGVGYLRLTVDGNQLLAHRVAWLLATGEWPRNEIDHINGNKADNRLANLRDVDRKTNSQNIRSPHKDNKSGLLGASWNKKSGKWQATIKLAGKTAHLGEFPTAEAAHGAFVLAKRNYHLGCSI